MPIEIAKLPVAFMNDDHAQAAAELETLQALAVTADRDALAAATRQFLLHNQQHFAREEAAMQATAFPAYLVHKAEHDRVLEWLGGLVAMLDAGRDDTALRQVVLDEIPAWLGRHIETMDRVTAGWITAREGTSGVRV